MIGIKKKPQFVEKVVIVDEAGADKYCRPQLHQNDMAEDSLRVSCVDQRCNLTPSVNVKGKTLVLISNLLNFQRI